MLWSAKTIYEQQDVETEALRKDAILEVAKPRFGPDRLYVDIKRRIGKAGGIRNGPDGYLYAGSGEEWSSWPTFDNKPDSTTLPNTGCLRPFRMGLATLAKTGSPA